MRRSDRELDLERKRDRAEEAPGPGASEERRVESVRGGWRLRVEGRTSVPCERLSLNFIRDADNTRSRRELRDSCFIREGKRRLRAPCIESQCSLEIDGGGGGGGMTPGPTDSATAWRIRIFLYPNYRPRPRWGFEISRYRERNALILSGSLNGPGASVGVSGNCALFPFPLPPPSPCYVLRIRLAISCPRIRCEIYASRGEGKNAKFRDPAAVI